ncbi:hypothetical protein [Ruegeria sp. HKCCSP335]|uniref:hypothetical protein n=1 Tax=Ruegeria sp. HKCCSP335 TaxID=2794833 RepID=UPI001AE7E5B6|nr:hypothetical protein [Ruegeria sp. HKCCSP335]
MKHAPNPMHEAHAAPRYTAKSKSTGLPWNNPVVKGWTVCRMHGARGGHGPGKANPAYEHGMLTREAQEIRKAVNEHVRLTRELEQLLNSSGQRQ